MTLMNAIAAPNLADLMEACGLVAPETLARAQLVQAETGEPLDSVLTRLGMVSEQALAEAMAHALSLPMAQARDFPQSALEIGDVSARFLREARALPFRRDEDGIDVAVADPFDPYPASALSFALGVAVRPHVARASDLEQTLDRLYGNAAQDAEALDDAADNADLEHLKDLASDAPIVRAVHGLITRAVEAKASDIHIEPAEDCLKIRLRIDGALQETDSWPAQSRAAVVSRIKVMSSLDIAERRLPQDGRLRFAVRGQAVDFRVATAPTVHGESVVLRILDRSSLALDFATLGFDEALLRTYIKVLQKPHGILLVTGPTGSGKTTTLYASLTTLNTPDRKILTVEDPIEYRLAGVNQTQVKHQIGLSFAAALRSFLRHDPDVVMVGEIRDIETAQVAVQAALTGHLILSTLHTNDAASAVTRLLDMGVEPYLISSVLNAVLAQRLVRRLCSDCREAYVPQPEVLNSFGLADEPHGSVHFYKAVGCPACRGTGFRGRLALLEFLPMSEPIARLALARAEARQIVRAAVEEGMRTIFDDGLTKARAGETTIEEVLRVTQEGP